MTSALRTTSESRQPAAPDRVPPLNSGDRLTAEEFERRYAAMPGTRAELVEGVVYLASPVSEDHGTSHFDLGGWLFVYSAMTPGVSGSSDGTIRLDLENRPQPDLHLKIRPSHGGRTRLSEDGYVVGAPELIVEIANSTVSYDLHDKAEGYRRNEVAEYLVWRVQDRAIDWFVLRDGRYDRSPSSADGVYRSEAFPGLWLDPFAAIRGDGATILRVLQEGLASPEHAAFVAGLQEAAIRAAVPPQPEAPRP